MKKRLLTLCTIASSEETKQDSTAASETASSEADNNSKYADILEKAKALSGAPCADVDSITEDGKIVIRLYEDSSDHIATTDWYTIDPTTLTGTNFLGDAVDLNK